MRLILNKLREKRGSGSVYFGIVLIIVAFIAMLVCINLFQLYGVHARAQLVSDTIADGAAIAGRTNLTFNESIAKEAAEEIFEANKQYIPDNSSISYTIDISEELNSQGASTGYYIIKTSCTLSVDTYGHNFFLSSLGGEPTHKTKYRATENSTVRCKLAVASDTFLDESYYYDREAYLGFATSTSGNRFGGYVSWLIKYYLSPEYNSIYLSNNTSFNSFCLLLDYYKCMGYDIEHFDFNSVKEFHWRLSNYNNSGAHYYTSASQIQMAADQGKPTVIVCRNARSSEIYEFYIVVPQNTTLLPNQIVVAHANGFNQNYQIIDWNEFCDQHTEIFAFSED